MPSLLEQLPNEIVLDILQYLKSLDLFESFNDLNWRFNQLLSVLMLSVNISEALSKHLFDDYCINVIPKCLTQTVSLKISDRFGRLTQFHKLFQLDMFMNIRSLILQNPTHDNLKLIMKKLSKLIHIEQLQIASYGPNKLDLNSCSKTMTEVIFQKKTTLKRVTLSFYSSIILDQTTIQTCNIEYLNMYGCYIDEFVTLLKHLPKIKRVDIHVYNSQNSDDTTDYKIYQNIGQYVPNLTLYIADRIFTDVINIDSIIQSFSTPFWILEREWYIVVDYIQKFESNEFLLYTVPRSKGSSLTIQLYKMQTATTAPSSLEKMYTKTDRLTVKLNNVHVPLIVQQFSDVKTLTLYSNLTSVDNTTTTIVDDLSKLVLLVNLEALHLYDKYYPSNLLKVILVTASNIINLSAPYNVLLEITDSETFSNLTSLTVTMNDEDDHFNVKVLKRSSFILDNLRFFYIELKKVNDLYLVLSLVLRKMKKLYKFVVSVANGTFSEYFQLWLNDYLSLNDLLSITGVEYNHAFNNLALSY
ncbi:unnamed protein product [Didymodactylos carnosus]|uniref:F-box domain-containing protein n=1 Tax=Didymodactylos carnosus TaxID=1234261 RepID=A0A8S2E3V4_9BILA|nr:unnamed protein product [Didymodactylos carnosus]CAF3842879.1 unnamed protein product [Didymodactylos carnosus]